mgnify:CR=1 FL=1
MPSLGYRHSKATRQRMSEAKRGTRASPAQRAAIADGVRRWWRTRRENESALKKSKKQRTLPASSLTADAGRVPKEMFDDFPLCAREA